MRIKLVYLFLMLFFFSLLSNLKINTYAAETLVFINEIFPDPLGSDTGKEWLELYNGSSSSVNLLGWKIKNVSAAGSIRTIDLPSIDLASNSYLILADSNLVVSNNIYYLPNASVNLFNTNSYLELYNQSGVLVETLQYSSSEENKSLERKGPLCSEFVKSSSNTIGEKNLNYDLSCWANLTSYAITPPANNDPVKEPSLTSYPLSYANISNYDKVIITEIYASPNSGEKEWVEIYNFGNESINLADFTLKDVTTSDEFDKSYTLSSIINPFNYLVIDTSGITLNNSGDRIGLFYKDILVDEVKYPSLSKGESYSRKLANQTYEDAWFKTFNVTRSLANTSGDLSVVSIKDLILNQYKDKVKIKGCLNLVRTVMPDNYAYIQDSTASIKIKLVDDTFLNIDDCIFVSGRLIKNSKDTYFDSEMVEQTSLLFNNTSILLESAQNYKEFEGQRIVYKNLIIKRKYTYSLLLENDLKMKFPEDFDSQDFEKEEHIDIEGVVIRLSGVYYIYPYSVSKSNNILGKSFDNTYIAIVSYPKNNSAVVFNTKGASSFSIYTWWVYLLIWLVSNMLFFYKIILINKNRLDKFITLRLKYLNAKSTSYFGKEIFHRNLPKTIFKKQSDV